MNLKRRARGRHRLPRVSTESSLLSVAGGQVTTHSHFTDGILRGALNYQFH
jgi:hypothetical protein